MSTSEIATVLAWHEALNTRDIATLVQLSSDDIEIAAPEHASQGIPALRDWAESVDTGFVPGRMYYRGGVVVVEENLYRSPAEKDLEREASAFRVVSDQVVSMFRHASLQRAFEATGLRESDRVADK
ncbi:nuclear transport factor 2 family protein [Hoyosella sp. YIM 151337]|uniref:nuclear transport factor 2 family protein n=1 Tax=Hoyosella sp. YIM 151337 TaxID=2992742 RepID=UPI0022364FDC|nr:nuclear transport factor 2 family protein [Hoyosella sp. YIM 151337]MCW4354946.1 nuclear transport factor 2 family protein [Hoyosella sp. YIM 151337]